MYRPGQLGHRDHLGRAETSSACGARTLESVSVGRGIQVHAHDDRVATSRQLSEFLFKNTDAAPAPQVVEGHDADLVAARILVDLRPVAVRLNAELDEPRRIEHA